MGHRRFYGTNALFNYVGICESVQLYSLPISVDSTKFYSVGGGPSGSNTFRKLTTATTSAPASLNALPNAQGLSVAVAMCAAVSVPATLLSNLNPALADLSCNGV